MKNKKSNKKIFRKTVKAASHKRKNRQRAENMLRRAIAETNVGCDCLHLSFSEDFGRGGRSSPKLRADEYKVRGVFSSSSSGYGFVTLHEEFSNLTSQDIFIPEDKTAGAITDDTVELIFHFYRRSDGREQTEGRIIKIIEYGRKTVIGTLSSDYPSRRNGNCARTKLYLLSDDPRFTVLPTVRDAGGAKIGDKVEAVLIRDGKNLSCEVIRSFGNALSRKANYEAILSEFDIPVEFSAAELCEAEFFASKPIPEQDRVKRNEVIFTIDGEGAKDLDDAVSLKKTKNGWLLGVHIADVSCYVPERSALDRAAMQRATSVYFVDRVVPMLPPALSNGACSLNAGEDKAALSAMISLSELGNITSVKLQPSIIRSRVRGVYSEVNAIFENRADPSVKKKYKEVLPSLMRMKELYGILSKRALERGMMQLEDAEAEIILNENEEPCQIIKRERGDAEKLIEQFMLTANEAVATLLNKRGIPCVYRVHEPPPVDKKQDFILYMQNLGFDIRGISKEDATAQDYSQLLYEAEKRDLMRPVSNVMLRSMSKAKYSTNNGGHFGLGLGFYCHFTSPIRRLSDLATHRIIHKVLLSDKKAVQYEKYAYRAAAAATEGELRAVSAERKIENLYKAIYMSEKIGEIFEGEINSVTNFGFFVELGNTCEGLVPIDELIGSYFYDDKNRTIRSRDTVYKIGDKLSVRLQEADIVRGKLRFSVV